MESTRNNMSRHSYGSRVNGTGNARTSNFGEGANGPTKYAEKPSATPTPRQEVPDGISADPAPRRNPPAQEFQHGRVVTRIWAHPTHWGSVCWQVDQLRKTEPTAPRAFTRSLEQQDLLPSRQGMHAAEQWIKKTERRLTRRSRGWGW